MGSGFFVGGSVVMTARHVVDRCRTVKVFVRGGRALTVAGRTSWHDGKAQLDLATLKLKRPVSDVYVFSLRPSQVPPRTTIAALGHPLGEGMSYTSGHVLGRTHDHLVLRVLSGQGYSGGPIVDNDGFVVGMINSGLFGRDPGVITGAFVGDNIIAYDFSSHWARWRRTLCKDYPNGGIVDCAGNKTPAAPSPPPTRSAPSPPKPSTWVPPAGFTLWTGAGTYTRGTLAYAYEPSCTPTSSFAGCWGVKVISRTGCQRALFVTVALDDANSVVVDTGIDQIQFVPAGKIVLAQSDSFSQTAVSYQVTEIDCFDY